MGLIPATVDHNPGLQVNISLDHMYSCKIKYILVYALCNCMFLKIKILI